MQKKILEKIAQDVIMYNPSSPQYGLGLGRMALYNYLNEIQKQNQIPEEEANKEEKGENTSTDWKTLLALAALTGGGGYLLYKMLGGGSSPQYVLKPRIINRKVYLFPSDNATMDDIYNYLRLAGYPTL